MNKLIFFMLLSTAIFSSGANAQNYAVYLSDMDITPETIYLGDNINATIKFSVSAPQSSYSSIKLSFFFDGQLANSITASYQPGTYTYSFGYHPDTDKILNREIKVTAKIYDGFGNVANEDSIAETVYIYPRTGRHDLRIVSLTVPQSANAGSSFLATATIKNNGDVREDNVQPVMIFKQKVYTLPSFSIAAGATEEKVFSLQAPLAAGTYTVEAQAKNAYNSENEKTTLRISAIFLSAAFSKNSVKANEWVEVSGYATKDGIKSAGSVSIYKDGIFAGVVPTTENGYYSTQVKFSTVGTHKLTAGVGDILKDTYIYISAPETATPTQPALEQTGKQNYSAVIIVTPDGQKIIYPVSDAGAPRGKYAGFSFVNVEANAKEMDAVQYSGNRVAITITNHLGRSALFSIETDFNENWVYLPKTDVVEDGEIKDMELYLIPDKTGEFSGNIMLFEGQNLIKKMPLTLFVAPPPVPAQQKPEGTMNLISTKQIGGIAAIFLAAVLAYIILKKPKALEPFSMAPLIEGVKRMSETTQRREIVPNQRKFVNAGRNGRANNGFFRVPRENIIM